MAATLPQYKLTLKDGSTIAVEDRDLLIVKDADNPDNAVVVDTDMLGGVFTGTITGGDASGAKQDTGNTSLSQISTNLGATGDGVAASDAATASLIALTKLTNTRLSTLIAGSGGGTATSGNQTSQITQATTTNTNLGAQADAVAASDAATASLIALVKLTNTRLSTLIASGGGGSATTGNQVSQITQETAINTVLGLAADAAVLDASGTVNAHIRGLVATAIAMSLKLPASLGTQTAANSLSTTTSSNDLMVAVQGGVTETAPASDTASSGLNGRLQRIAQRITSFIALFPISLGAKLKTTSLAVTLATDEPLNVAIGGISDAAVVNPALDASQIAALKGILTGINALISTGINVTAVGHTENNAITMATAASTALSQSTAIDNSTTNYADMSFQGTLVMASAPAAGTTYNVYFAPKVSASTYAANASGTSGAYTANQHANLKFVSFTCNGTDTTYRVDIPSFCGVTGYAAAPASLALIHQNLMGVGMTSAVWTFDGMK